MKQSNCGADKTGIMAAGHDVINHPSWYCDGGIETLDFILAKKLDFLTGQVVKYLSRAGKKDPGKALEDLKKAQFYLNRKVAEMEAAEGAGTEAEGTEAEAAESVGTEEGQQDTGVDRDVL